MTGFTTNALRTSNRRCRYFILMAVLLSVCGTTFLLSWYQSSVGLLWRSRYIATNRQEIPSLQQEMRTRYLQKIVEEFWIYLKAEITALALDKSLKNSTSEEQLTKLNADIDEIGYRRWMHIKNLKSMCLNAISAWNNMRKDLLNMEESSGLKYIGLLVKNADDFPRLLERELDQLTDIVDAPSDWKKQESLDLGEIVQRNMYDLQNPSNCSNVKKLLCQYEPMCGTGFGCQVHHVSSCLLMAYATNRTLIISSKHWTYKTKWESVFLPFTSKCTAVDMSKSTAQLGAVDWESKPVVNMPHLNKQKNKSQLLPPALPAHLTDKILHFHGNPNAWWVGQFLRYAMRGQPEFNQLLVDTMHDMNFTHPIVGVHIRRTDKLLRESKLYPVEEYMFHVTSWYNHYERWNPHTNIEKKVFVATDEPSLLRSLEKKYPGYVFIYDRSRSETAAVNNRRSDSSFTGITLDMTLLSMTDFLVCTFTSNVGRAAYALMQTRNGDASQWAVSLDKTFYYTGQNPYTVKAIANHTARNHRKILSAHETISHVTKFQNGILRGTLKSGQTGMFPTFKTVDLIKRVNMPQY